MSASVTLAAVAMSTYLNDQQPGIVFKAAGGSMMLVFFFVASKFSVV
jgi:hypothetical protein